jgi:hypothetical protein
LIYGAVFQPVCSQQWQAEGSAAQVVQQQFNVGQSIISLRTFSFDTETPFLLLHLHSDEVTAAETAYEAAHQWGIQFLQVQNERARLVSFRFNEKIIQFDPNRIFSDEGIRKTLQLSNGDYPVAAFEEVTRFAQSLLSLFPVDKPVVALHNNTDGRFTILQYKEAGSGQVHVNDSMDVDDFFITNDEEIFNQFKEKNFNVVLEDASGMEEDGSLSLYCSRQGIRYINVEAQHGHRQEQQAMLDAVRQILQ